MTGEELRWSDSLIRADQTGFHGKTYVRLTEQDAYDYHDCDSSASYTWQKLYNEEGNFISPRRFGCFPF